MKELCDRPPYLAFMGFCSSHRLEIIDSCGQTASNKFVTRCAHEISIFHYFSQEIVDQCELQPGFGCDMIEIKSRQEKVILSCCLSSQVVTGRDATSPLRRRLAMPQTSLLATDRSRALDLDSHEVRTCALLIHANLGEKLQGVEFRINLQKRLHYFKDISYLLS